MLIEESHEPPEPPAPPTPLKVAAPVEKVANVEKVEPKKRELAVARAVPSSDGASKPRGATIAPATPVVPREQPGQRSKPELYVPPPIPDDPGVSSSDPDESPASLERLRAAQIR